MNHFQFLFSISEGRGSFLGLFMLLVASQAQLVLVTPDIKSTITNAWSEVINTPPQAWLIGKVEKQHYSLCIKDMLLLLQ